MLEGREEGIMIKAAVSATLLCAMRGKHRRIISLLLPPFTDVLSLREVKSEGFPSFSPPHPWPPAVRSNPPNSF